MSETFKGIDYHVNITKRVIYYRVSYARDLGLI